MLAWQADSGNSQIQKDSEGARNLCNDHGWRNAGEQPEEAGHDEDACIHTMVLVIIHHTHTIYYAVCKRFERHQVATLSAASAPSRQIMKKMKK